MKNFLFFLSIFFFFSCPLYSETKTPGKYLGEKYACDLNKVAYSCQITKGSVGRPPFVLSANYPGYSGHVVSAWVSVDCENPDAYKEDFYIYLQKYNCSEDDLNCEHYSSLFDPPPNNCIFDVEYGNYCVDGEDNVVQYDVRFRDSQGRVSPWQNSKRTPENEDVECETVIVIPSCDSEAGECFKPLNTGNCVYKDSNGNYQLKPGCLPNSGSGVGEGSGGGSSGGDSGGGSSGGDFGGGSSGGDSGGGSGSGDGSGSGSGKDYSGKLSEMDKKLDDINKRLNWGNRSEIESAANEGGWGDGGGEYSIDRGSSEHKKILDGLSSKGPIKEIKNRNYIVTSNSFCSANIFLLNRSFSLSLCEFEAHISFFGRLLFNITGLAGLLMILRR